MALAILIGIAVRCWTQSAMDVAAHRGSQHNNGFGLRTTLSPILVRYGAGSGLYRFVFTTNTCAFSVPPLSAHTLQPEPSANPPTGSISVETPETLTQTTSTPPAVKTLPNANGLMEITDGPLTLTGTWVGLERPLALIEAEGGQSVYHLGDQVNAQLVLHEIQPRFVLLQTDAGLARLAMDSSAPEIDLPSGPLNAARHSPRPAAS